MTLATWNGRTVVVDDDLPAVTGYADAEADTPGALVIKASGASGASEIDLAKATPYFGTRTLPLICMWFPLRSTPPSSWATVLSPMKILGQGSL